MPFKTPQSAVSNQKKRSFLSSFSKLTIILFFVGFLTGCLAANLLEDSLYAPALALFQNTLKNISSLAISRNDVFLYSCKENIKFFLLLIFFSLTNVWRLYYTGFTLYTGFSHGLLCSFCVLLYGPGGIIRYFCFLLPQVLFLAPAFLFAMRHLEALHSSWFFSEEKESAQTFFFHSKRRQLLFSKLPPLLLCVILLLCSALLEGYLNIPLLKYYHSSLY